MRRLTLAVFVGLTGVLVARIPAFADPLHVHASSFDPAHSNLVNSDWVDGLGCPTNQTIQVFLPPDFSTTGSATYADTACPTGDPKDNKNAGLLMVKTGPTNDNAAAVAQVSGVKNGTVLSELGFDIRKQGGGAFPNSALLSGPAGSHCGAGAPRFNVTTTDGNFYFIGCNSPGGTVVDSSAGWMRLRWGDGTPGSVSGFLNGGTLTPITAPIAKDGIQMVFDEGQDTGPDNFGAAVLDNIDVNGVLVGQGN